MEQDEEEEVRLEGKLWRRRRRWRGAFIRCATLTSSGLDVALEKSPVLPGIVAKFECDVGGLCKRPCNKTCGRQKNLPVKLNAGSCLFCLRAESPTLCKPHQTSIFLKVIFSELK